MSKKVLIITYYWPPSGGVGTQRWMYFVLNLKKMGWDPIVYTPSNPQFEIKDPHLLELTKDIRVVKRPIWEPFSIFQKITGGKNKHQIQQGLVLEKEKKGLLDNLFIWIRGNLFIPDSRVFWRYSSVKFLSGLTKTENINTIVTTGPPHSMHLIGLGLKKRNSELKWLADFRDPWSDWDILPKLKVSSMALKRHQFLERKVFDNANQILTVSKRLGQALEKKGTKKETVEVILNGIPSANTDYLSLNKTPESTFTIGYFGMLNELRDPEDLWKLLSEICKQNEQFAKKLKIRLGGIVSSNIKNRLLNDSQLHDKVTLLGYIPHQTVFEEYKKCDVLLLLLNKSDNAKWILPVKFFEYLSAARPILGIGPKDSDLGDLFEGKKIGEIYSNEQKNEISAFIMSIFDQEYEVELSHYKKLLHENSRYEQAISLARLLEKL